MNLNLTIGDVIELVYATFLDRYGDEELAALATSAVLNDVLSHRAAGRGLRPVAEERAA